MLEGLRRIAVKTELTSGPGHAVQLALQAQAYGGVIAVGGDGTLFEILKGIDRKEQRIALIPVGRGNSLARDLGLLHRPLLDVIHWEQARFIDLMAVHVTTANGVRSRHLSASTVALGYPAAVTLRARKLASLGKMSYAAAAAATWPLHFGARIQYEDEVPKEVRLSGFVANNTRHLANFQAFRQASCSDGLFETMEMDAGIAKQTLHNLSALSGTGAYEPSTPRQARNAKIQLDSPQSLMMDGELFPQVICVDISILPSAFVCNGPGAS
jgi:diacylglycerol kinase family enzyme